MRDFGSADAERVGPERAMRRGVAVAADDQQARQSQPLLGADNVHDALTQIAKPKELDAVFRSVVFKRPHHRRDLGIGDRAAAAARRHVMVGDAEGQRGLGHRATALMHLRKRMERSFMHIVAVDPEQRRSVLAPGDLVRRPQFVDQSLRLAHTGRCASGPVGLSRVADIVC